jgi:divalent metal cation (Fe/Co/Zn/Cd) transporter
MEKHNTNLISLVAAIWLFYIGFVVLGVGVGIIVGFFLGNILLFALFGLIIGLGLGILANAILIAISAFR